MSAKSGHLGWWIQYISAAYSFSTIPCILIETESKLEHFTLQDGILELEWKSPGRIPIQEMTTPQKKVDVVREIPEEELKRREKQNMLSMFDADDFSHQGIAPGSLTKTPARTPKNTPKAKASFDKIFNRVSLLTTADDKPANDSAQ